MGRARKTAHEMLGLKVTPIHPEGIYKQEELPALLRVGRDVIEREVRSGRLQHGYAGGRNLFRGSWLIEWIESVRVSPDDAGGVPRSDAG